VLSHDTVTRGGRPALPQRHAQENLVPELRDGPVTGRTRDRQEAAHDPELMAAFRRGISLAEDDSDESSAGNSS
jgi:hypothetical protein